MADQMAAPLLSLHDKNSPIKTPNLDRLAEGGVGVSGQVRRVIIGSNFGGQLATDHDEA
jgi:hypothetical protein